MIQVGTTSMIPTAVRLPAIVGARGLLGVDLVAVRLPALPGMVCPAALEVELPAEQEEKGPHDEHVPG